MKTTKISPEQLDKIKEFALDLDWNRAFGGKSKGNRHLFRVVSLVKKIIEEERFFQEIDPSIIEAGAWLHDSGLAVDIQGAALCNEENVKYFLTYIGIKEEDIALILGCIESHDGRSGALSKEAQVVHDADTLEKLGPLGIVRETWKRSQMGWNTEKIVTHLPGHLEKRKNNLYTLPAKERAEKLMLPLKEFFFSLQEQLKEE